MWPFKETPTPVDKKKKKVRKGLMNNEKPFPGNLRVGTRAIRKHKKQLEEALTYGE